MFENSESSTSSLDVLPPSHAPGNWHAVVLIFGAMLAGLILRIAPVGFPPHIAAPTGDDDATYHLLRAERIAAQAPDAPWFDLGMNYPEGANIPWPPLFDAMLVAGAHIASIAGTPATQAFLESATWLPVLCGLLAIPLLAWLGNLLRPGSGIYAAWIVALLPAHALFSMAGRCDQHVTEFLFALLIFGAMAPGLRTPESPRGLSVLLLATVFTAAFWNWMGSGLYPLLLTAFSGLWFIFAGTSDASAQRFLRDLRDGAALGTLLLAATLVAARGFAGLQMMSVCGLTGFHVMLLALAASFAAAVLQLTRLPAANGSAVARGICVAVAAIIPLGLALSLPAFRDSIAHAVAGVARTSAWYANVSEFDPVLFGGFDPLATEFKQLIALYGITLFAMPFAGAILLREFRKETGSRGPLAFVLMLGITFLCFGLFRKRFALYLVIPLAIWSGVLLHTVARRLANGKVPLAALAPWVVGALLIGPALALTRESLIPETPQHLQLRHLLQRAEMLPVRTGYPAILAEWAYGHLIQYASGMRAIATPFGIEGGEGAMEDTAAFFLATDPAQAEGILERRKAGLVLLADPRTEIYFARSFGPPGTPAYVTKTWNPKEGARIELSPGILRLIPVRLWLADGAAIQDQPALTGFRLLDESEADSGGHHFKMFGVVPGATIATHNQPPGAVIRANLTVTAADGRKIAWETSATTSAQGEARLRIPYATGRNGNIYASPVTVTLPAGRHVVEIRERSVLNGHEVSLR